MCVPSHGPHPATPAYRDGPVSNPQVGEGPQDCEGGSWASVQAWGCGGGCHTVPSTGVIPGPPGATPAQFLGTYWLGDPGSGIVPGGGQPFCSCTPGPWPLSCLAPLHPGLVRGRRSLRPWPPALGAGPSACLCSTMSAGTEGKV